MTLIEQVEQIELLKSSAMSLLVDDDGYRKLRSELHPDRFPFNTPIQARAQKAFVKLEKLYELMKKPDIEISSKNFCSEECRVDFTADFNSIK